MPARARAAELDQRQESEDAEHGYSDASCHRHTPRDLVRVYDNAQKTCTGKPKTYFDSKRRAFRRSAFSPRSDY